MVAAWPRVQTFLDREPAPTKGVLWYRVLRHLQPYPPGIYVFMYHSIGDPELAHPWESAYQKVATDVVRFQTQINYLMRYMTPMSLSEATEVVSRQRLDRPYFVLTFDDGYKTVLRVSDFLSKHGLKPGIFVNSRFASYSDVYYRVKLSCLINNGHLSDLLEETTRVWPDRKLNASNLFTALKEDYTYGVTEAVVHSAWERSGLSSLSDTVHLGYHELRSLEEAGWEIGNHTSGHPTLSGLSYEEVDEEISGNHSALQNEGLNPIPWIGYPNGRSKHVGESTYQWMKEHPDYQGAHGGGGVNFVPTRTEWLRIAVGDFDLSTFKLNLDMEIEKTKVLMEKKILGDSE